jgi:hypothetical protein
MSILATGRRRKFRGRYNRAEELLTGLRQANIVYVQDDVLGAIRQYK